MKKNLFYYDPKIKENEEFSRGPIVIHGGFTSAFYDFSFEGTGRLIISIACWLMRPEENILDEDGNFNYEKKYVPQINPIYNNSIFDKWISTYSILILDMSGSMTSKYGELVK